MSLCNPDVEMKYKWLIYSFVASFSIMIQTAVCSIRPFDDDYLTIPQCAMDAPLCGSIPTVFDFRLCSFYSKLSAPLLHELPCSPPLFSLILRTHALRFNDIQMSTNSPCATHRFYSFFCYSFFRGQMLLFRIYFSFFSKCWSKINLFFFFLLRLPQHPYGLWAI